MEPLMRGLHLSVYCILGLLLLIHCIHVCFGIIGKMIWWWKMYGSAGDENLREEAPITGNEELSAEEEEEDEQKWDSQQDVELDSSPRTQKLESVVKKPYGNYPQPAPEMPPHSNPSESGDQTISRRFEIPTNAIGLLIGKGGETIRGLQYNSGAVIQIIRHVNFGAATVPIKLIGTVSSINKAEQMIKEAIAPRWSIADAGGSPALLAKGLGLTLAAGVTEQIQIQVPYKKAGLVIGKGGKTLRDIQARSGVLIKLQPLPDGENYPKERTLRVSGDKKQIDIAMELIREAMNRQNVNRHSTPLSNFGQQHAYSPPKATIVHVPYCPHAQTVNNYPVTQSYAASQPVTGPYQPPVSVGPTHMSYPYFTIRTYSSVVSGNATVTNEATYDESSVLQQPCGCPSFAPALALPHVRLMSAHQQKHPQCKLHQH